MTETQVPEDTVPLGDGSDPVFSEPGPEWRKDFEGLLYIGQLTTTFEYLHHKIVIRTLKTDEVLIVAQLTAEWMNTIAVDKAFATAMVALATEYIDGQPLPTPLGESTNPLAWARTRFDWARRLYPYVIDAIYDQYLVMEARVLQILDDMGKGSGQGAATPGSNGLSASPTAGDS